MSEATIVTETDILSRVIAPDEAGLPPEMAQVFLGLSFRQTDIDRMHELAEKNRQDSLTDTERAEMESYLRIGSFLNLLKSKARLSLQHSSGE